MHLRVHFIAILVLQRLVAIARQTERGRESFNHLVAVNKSGGTKRWRGHMSILRVRSFKTFSCNHVQEISCSEKRSGP